MQQGYDSDIEDSFGEYQRSVRGRAKATLDELQSSLKEDPAVNPSDRRHARSRISYQSGFRERSGSWSGGLGITEHADYVYGAAADRLQSMLNKYETTQQPKNVQFRSPSKYSVQTNRTRTYNMYNKTTEDMCGSPPPPRGYIPSSEEALPLIQNQSVLLQQLETENKFIKEELSVLKQRQKELVEENRLLHEELKKSVVQEILQGSGHHQTITDDLLTEINRTDINVNVNQSNLSRWKYELERLNALHGAKTKQLEGQLGSAKSEVERLEKEIMELRTKLRISESGAKGSEGVKGLCVRCGQSEAVLPATYANQTQAIDKLTKERDDLVSEMMRLRGQIQELRGKEDEAYQQVKKSVEMVEQAQLEQTQAMIQAEQLKEELANLQARMEQYTNETAQKMTSERESARNETSKERQQLNNKIEELTAQLTQTQLQLDKVSRDKVSLVTELESMKEDVSGVDRRFYQQYIYTDHRATDGMRVSVTTANVEREAAVIELKRAKQENEKLEKSHEAEKQRMKTELQDLRRRLEKAETEVIAAKEECIHLHTTNQSLEREVHLAKLSKDAIEKTRNDDVAAMTKRAQQREDELNVLLETLQNKHAKTNSELEEITKNQSSLIQKLREECRNLAERLDSVTRKYKEDNRNLKTQVDQLKHQASKQKKKIGDLEETNEQHGQLQTKMRDRLKELDAKAQKSGQQILELLAKEGGLMKDRHLLAGEVKFLREQLECFTHHRNKRYSFDHHRVDDVLNNVKVDHDKNGKYQEPTYTAPSNGYHESQRIPSPQDDNPPSGEG